MNDDKDDEKKVIHFPELEKRRSMKKNKRRATKEAKKILKAQETTEDRYRAEYRAQRAKNQTHMARQSASGKISFINWDKIPFFTRCAVATFIIVQIIMTFGLSEADKAFAILNFGFIPAIYTGSMEWSWMALIAPFTTLIIHGGWMHLLFNVVMMMAMGVFFEREFGAKRTAAFFLACGMTGNLAYLFLNPGSLAPVVGASGAISGLFSVAILIMIERGLMGPEAQKRGPFPFILLWSTIIIGLGLITSDTAWQSHIGGFLGGAGIFNLWKKGKIRF